MIHVYHPGEKGAPMQDIIFVCQHGGAKSLIAAEYFTRLAGRRGLELRGVCAGLEPYPEVPAPVIVGLAAQGIDVSGHTPRQVTADMLAAAAMVVHFGCDVAALVEGGVSLDWGDVPAVSDGFHQACEVIVQRVERLVETMVPRGSQSG